MHVIVTTNQSAQLKADLTDSQSICKNNKMSVKGTKRNVLDSDCMIVA